MFILFSSYDCGSSYHKEQEAETIEELHPKMKELDDSMLRWYIEKDGEQYTEELCSIHKNIIGTMRALNK